MAKKSIKKGTSEAQKKATAKYLAGRSRFIIWYSTEVKRNIVDKIKKKKLTHKQIFEDGLKLHKIKVQND